jgi:uncharacterized membrane protein YedE/YeeE
MPSPATSLTIGLTFGAALTLSGVAAPRVILSQFHLTNFHMLLTFLSASLFSAAIFSLAHHTSFHSIPARKNSPLGSGPYTGNILGGLLLGVGMALTGACPGTVLVQAAARVPASSPLLLGGLLAGIAFVRWDAQATQPTPSLRKHSLPSLTGLPPLTVTLFYSATLLTLLVLTSKFAPVSGPLFQPLFGGLLIGLAQAASVLLARKPLGVSTAYEDVGRAVLGKPGAGGWANVTFAGGIVLGARLVMTLLPGTLEAFQGEGVSAPVGLLGGFCLVFGARVAGGCTSGHGISGMSAMGVSSFITVACMFAGGIVAAAVVVG